jgi:hypothetical protein
LSFALEVTQWSFACDGSSQEKQLVSCKRKQTNKQTSNSIRHGSAKSLVAMFVLPEEEAPAMK